MIHDCSFGNVESLKEWEWMHNRIWQKGQIVLMPDFRSRSGRLCFLVENGSVASRVVRLEVEG